MPDSRRKRRHDGAPCGVSLDMQDAAGPMGGLAAQRQMPFKVLVEGNAVAKQVLDALPRFPRHEQGDLCIDDATPRAHRIGGVRLGSIALRQRRG